MAIRKYCFCYVVSSISAMNNDAMIICVAHTNLPVSIFKTWHVWVGLGMISPFNDP